MGRSLKYRPGSWYITSDRTGFPQRAESVRRQWDNQMVEARLWEARHPQDLVRGVPDRQAVPVARPKPPPQFAGLAPAALAYAAPPQSAEIYLTNTSGMAQGDLLRVMLDTGAFHTAICVLPPAADGAVVLSRALPTRASIGNLVYDLGPAPAGGGQPIVQQGGNRPITTQGGVPLTTQGGGQPAATSGATESTQFTLDRSDLDGPDTLG